MIKNLVEMGVKKKVKVKMINMVSHITLSIVKIW